MSLQFLHILVFCSTFACSVICLNPKYLVLQSCDFEDGNLCDFKQDNEPSNGIDWSFGNSKDKPAITRGTGPEDAYGESLGYLFIDSRSSYGNSARIRGPYLNYMGPACVRFAYCMNGKDVKTLNMDIRSGDLQGTAFISESKFTTNGNKGKQWNKIELDINLSYADSVVVFEGEGPDDKDDLGDIAIDEFVMTQGSCAHSKLMMDGIWHCDFSPQTGDSSNNELCGFINDDKDTDDWEQGEVNSGISPHAGYLGTRYFLMVPGESSKKVARIYTPNLQQSSLLYCLRFAYHMYHAENGKLNVYMLSDNTHSDIWSNRGPLMDEWFLTELDILLSGHNTKFIFEVVSGGIALDDIHIYIGKCDGTYSEGIDECLSEICLNHGTCKDLPFGYECYCVNGFMGVNCEYDSMSKRKDFNLHMMDTWQTTTADGAEAIRAADGNFKTCIKTTYGTSPEFWYIDLGRSYYVYSIKITPSTHVGEVLKNTMLGTASSSADKFAQVVEHFFLCAQSIDEDWPANNTYTGQPVPYAWNCMRDGQFMVIYKANQLETNQIILCEVEIATEDMSEDKDIAMFKMASQSTTFFISSSDTSFTSENANDNDDITCAGAEDSDRNPWWAVDLVNTFLIHTVRVVGYVRLQHLQIGATDFDPQITEPNQENIRWCNRQDGDPHNHFNNSCWEKGRYLVIMRENESVRQFVLCTVQAYGSLLEPTPGVGCASNPCRNGGSCQDVVTGYLCICPAGLRGINCEIYIDICSSKPCANGGTCLAGTNWFTCTCTPEFEEFQEHNCVPDGVEECDSRPCLNGGTCKDRFEGFTCECATGYSNIHCEDYDKCSSSPCLNGGTCKDKGMEYVCECTAGVTGINCKILHMIKIRGYNSPIEEGQALNLICEIIDYADDEASAQYVWKFTQIHDSRVREIGWKKWYSKTDVTTDDSGVYTCFIMNLQSVLPANLTVNIRATAKQAPNQDAPPLSSGAIIGVIVSMAVVAIITIVGVVLVKKRVLKLPNGKFPTFTGKFPTFTLKQTNSTKEDQFQVQPTGTKEDQFQIQRKKTIPMRAKIRK